MKLTKEQADYIRSKPSFQNEGIIQKLFGKFLKSKLRKDKDFQRAVDDYDRAADKLGKSLEKLEKDGVKIPDELKKFMDK